MNWHATGIIARWIVHAAMGMAPSRSKADNVTITALCRCDIARPDLEPVESRP